MTGTPETPFAGLTLIVAPAILTNASSLLAMGTSNRFARAVDRQRQLSELLEAGAAGGKPLDRDTAAIRLRQLRITELRGQLLLRALTSFYVSLGSFASAALIALVGATFEAHNHRVASAAVGIAALAAGGIGVANLVFGCTLLVRETRKTLASLRDEAAFSKQRFQGRVPAEGTARSTAKESAGAAQRPI